MNHNAKKRRLFFSWPNDQVRRSIGETFSRFPEQKNGRAILPHNLHMTLYFIGPVTEEFIESLHAAAQTISANSFKCHLDCYGYFSSAKSLWMGCQEPPLDLLQLHKKLGEAIEGCGVHTEKRALTPHLTLMKKSVKPGSLPMDFSIPWFVDVFTLVESHLDKHGANYQVIEKYPLSSTHTNDVTL